MAALALLFFSLRMTAKVALSLPWGLDDTMTALSVVFMITFFISLQIRLGRDIWYLSDNEITAGFKLFLFLELIYVVALAIIKAAILCFFLRIFPDDRFKVMVKCTLVFDFLIGLTFFIFSFFQTQPLSMFWQGWQQKQSHLVMAGITRATLPHAGLNLVLDIWMIVLPLTQLWGLGLKLRKKLGVIAMFSVGIL
ncbi:hypothetical protein ACHAPU_009576 [Fusarium lateritium]